jgi:hypothetical protein
VSRAVSTVLDVAVFLLLLSAAIGTLALPPSDGSAPDASPARTTLATSTASVDYSLSPGARAADSSLAAFPRTDGPEFERTAHGSRAGLLADAAVRNLTVDGAQVTRTSDDFERAAARAVRNATGPRTRVVATWVPYRGSQVRGRVATGRRPPPEATVAGETLVVESGMPAARQRAVAAADRSGFAGVARVVANATIAGLFPRSQMRLTLRGDYPDDRLVQYRYRRFGRSLGADPGLVEAADVTDANARFRLALAREFQRDLRARYDSPAAAARAVRVGEVRIVVRRWST